MKYFRTMADFFRGSRTQNDCSGAKSQPTSESATDTSSSLSSEWLSSPTPSPIPISVTEVKAATNRPHAWIESIRFNDGSTISLSKDEIIIFVGPNNAGKSAILKEIDRRLTYGKRPTTVIESADFCFSYHSVDDFIAWIKTTYSMNHDGKFIVPMVGVISIDDIKRNWSTKDTGIYDISKFIAVRLTTEARLSAANPVDLVNLLNDAPNSPLHRIYEDDRLENKIDNIVSAAFGNNLIVNRAAGRQVVCHFGNRPAVPTGRDRFSYEYRVAVNALPTVQAQGDGVRAFVGVVLGVLAADYDIVFIDEPEAFLHPPQATQLGRVLADHTPDDRQLAIATHSADFLKGMLDSCGHRVRVVRVNRIGNKNTINELSANTLRQLWSDPLLRFSKVLDGLFHHATVICEGDADCRFYEAVMNALWPKGHPDLLFVYAAGKNRMAMIARALRAIGVPLRIVADIDILANEKDLSNLVNAFGADWSQVEKHYRVVRSAIQQLRAQIPVIDARREIIKALDEERQSTLSQSTIGKVKDVLRRGSAWAEAKRMGKNFIPAGQAAQEFDVLNLKLREIGIFLVEVGELEGFCKTIGAHGPSWAVEALQREIASDPELEPARQFVRSLVESLELP